MSGDGVKAVLCLLLILAAVCSALISDSKGVITPMDPYVYLGDELVLTCNLTKRTVYENASSMFFTWGTSDTRVDASQVRILSPTSIRLRKRMSGEEDGGTYVCWLGQGGGKREHLGHTMVFVDYMPVPVRNVSCFVDNWDSMNCSWTLDQTYIHPNHINVSLIWTIGNEQVPCPEMNTTWCMWRTANYIPEATYNMVIIVKNLKTTEEAKSKVFTIHSWDFVKPHPVRDLRVDGSNSTCLKISWQSSERYRQFEYNVTYDFNPGVKDSHRETRTSLWLDTEATLCDLNPFTLYTIRVAAKPIPLMNRSSKKPAGFLSDWVSVEGQTKEGVPVRAPPMHPGGFVQNICSEGPNCRVVTLYWKPVERQYLHGQLEGYELLYREEGTKQEQSMSKSLPKSLSTDLDLSADRNYHVSLFARNSVGVSQANSSLVIPRGTGDTFYPQEVTVEVEEGDITRFRVQWKPPAEGRALSYTVFWCKGDRASFRCPYSLDWLPLKSNQSRAEVDISNIESIDSYLLGVSAEVESPSGERIFSGIVWSKCNYRSGEVPKEPQTIRISPNDPEGLRVEWSMPDCLDSRSYVTQYEVAYCSVNPQDECSEPLDNDTVSNQLTSHVIRVEAGKRYKVLVTALAEAGRGPAGKKFYNYRKASDILAADSFNSVLGLAMGLLFAGIFIILGIFLLVRKMLELKKKHLPIETPAKIVVQVPVVPGMDPTYEKIPILEKPSRRDGRELSVDSETALLGNEEAVDRRPSTSGKSSKTVRAVPPPVRQLSRQSSGDGYCQQVNYTADHRPSNPHSRTLSPDSLPGSQGGPSLDSGYQPHDPLSASLPPRQPEVGFRPEVMMVRGYVDPATTFSFARPDGAIARGSQEAAPAPRRDQSTLPMAVENIPLQHNATSTHGRRGSNPAMGYAKAAPQKRTQDSFHAVGNAGAALQNRQQEGLYSISDYTGPPPDKGRPGRIPSAGNTGASIPYRGLDGIPGMGNSATSAPHKRLHDSRPYVGHATSQETRPLVAAPYSRQAASRAPASTPLLQEEPQEEDDLATGPDSGFDSLGSTPFGRGYVGGSQVPRQGLMGEDDFSDSRFRGHVGLGYVPESSLSTFCPRQ